MSRTRVLWFLISVLLFLVFSITGFVISKQQNEVDIASMVSQEMPLKKVAKTLGVSSDYLARELGIKVEIDKEEKISKYEVTDMQFAEGVAHITSHKPAVFKQFIMIGLGVFAIFFLLLWGRSEKNGKWYYNRTPYYIALAITVIASFWLGKSPSPMEEVVKLFKAQAGLYPDVMAKTIGPVVLILVFGVLVNKVICGWMCPFGALQELGYSIPWIGKGKRIKLPFWISNTIRAVLFIAFILVLFGVVGDLKGVTIYHFINPFNLFDLSFSYIWMAVCVAVSLIGGLFIYRPFCHFICPMGFVSWVFEQVSIFKVRINKDTCIECGQCEKACPSNACKTIVEGKTIKDDCYSCARCLSVCPKNAIKYGLKFKDNK